MDSKIIGLKNVIGRLHAARKTGNGVNLSPGEVLVLDQKIKQWLKRDERTERAIVLLKDESSGSSDTSSDGSIECGKRHEKV